MPRKPSPEHEGFLIRLDDGALFREQQRESVRHSLHLSSAQSIVEGKRDRPFRDVFGNRERFFLVAMLEFVEMLQVNDRKVLATAHALLFQPCHNSCTIGRRIVVTESDYVNKPADAGMGR